MTRQQHVKRKNNQRTCQSQHTGYVILYQNHGKLPSRPGIRGRGQGQGQTTSRPRARPRPDQLEAKAKAKRICFRAVLEDEDSPRGQHPSNVRTIYALQL